MFEAEPGDNMLHRFAESIEDIDERADRLLEIARDEMFDAFGMSVFCCFNLRCDAHMTGSTLTVATDGASNRDHGQSPKPNAIRTQTHQLDRVCCRAYAAIRPEFHFVAQTCFS